MSRRYVTRLFALFAEIFYPYRIKKILIPTYFSSKYILKGTQFILIIYKSEMNCPSTFEPSGSSIICRTLSLTATNLVHSPPNRRFWG